VNKPRPINLNLFTIKFPITAIISILHRVSGVFLFLMIPFFLWILSISLSDATQFSNLQACFSCVVCKLILLSFLTMLFYHMLAGMRHLLMDAGWGESLATARCSARFIIVLTVIFVLLVGVWLW
jgi:succinate dehydrogenase / fumarate reductase cytochrome b subunit